ncbi:MAG TPA: response regulator transcription factor [Chitinophagaceae bacterium]|nr:response regulator transcription factor [Chitinophagaceae bacterium]
MQNEMLILVIDDDPDICTMIKMVLEYHGYAATDADGEEKTKKILLTEPVELIIMDMLLSGSDGTDICRQLKQDEKTSSIPILMFSAHPNAKEICLEAGADDFISKPFEMEDLMDKISFFLQPKKVG